MTLGHEWNDEPVEDCECGACSWSRYWNGLTQEEKDAELAMIYAYDGGDE